MSESLTQSSILLRSNLPLGGKFIRLKVKGAHLRRSVAFLIVAIEYS